MRPNLHGYAYNNDTGILLLWGVNTKALMAEWNYGRLVIGCRDKRYSYWNYSRKYEESIQRGYYIGTNALKTAPAIIAWHEGALTMERAARKIERKPKRTV